MKNSIIIKNVNPHGRRIDYEYTVEGEWMKYFNLEVPFYVEYSQDVSAVPKSIAIIPILGTVVIMAAIFDADIYVDELDADFYDCIPRFLKGYTYTSLRGKKEPFYDCVHAGQIVHNPALNEKKRDLIFFSGGVDAWFTLLSHVEEKPDLVTVWGADMREDNDSGWKNIVTNNQVVADRFGLNLLTIRAPLRHFINEGELAVFSLEYVHDGWWPAFHHSLGMYCMAAPLCCGARSKLYFAATFSAKDHADWGHYVLASAPEIDNQVLFCGCQVVHDGYEYARHDKISKFCETFRNEKDKPVLRVCYSSESGHNCGMCEKCASASMSILLSDEDPNEYGIPYDRRTFEKLYCNALQEMARIEKYAFLSEYWEQISALKRKYKEAEVPKEWRILYHVVLKMLADFLHVPCLELEDARKGEGRYKWKTEQLSKKVDQLERETSFHRVARKGYHLMKAVYHRVKGT